MADDQPMIASAVVVPDEQPALSPATRSTSPSAKKRSLSFASDAGGKRPRISEVASGHSARTNRTSQDEPEQGQRKSRGRNGAAEERKRGQRLFGALLGTLSQSSTSATQKRREIERRQQAKIRQQAEEDDQKLHLQADVLRRKRMKEQRQYDEQSMDIRHDNALSMANFLQTKTEPRLYYRPWNPTLDEEDQIKRQIENAEADVQRERDDLRHRNQVFEEDEMDVAQTDATEQNQSEVPNDPTTTSELPTLFEKGKSPRPVSANGDPEQERQNGNVEKNVQESLVAPNEEDDHTGDDNGEEVLEAEEDTVLY